MVKTRRFVVLGGGITGQMVQWAVPQAIIYDWKAEPTHMKAPTPLVRAFGANFLWEPINNLPCRQFQVINRIDGQVPTPEAILEYKKKVGRPNPYAWEEQRQFAPEMTGYDLLSMPLSSVRYNHRVLEINRLTKTITFAPSAATPGGTTLNYDVLISTIPLYSLLSMVGVPEPQGRLQFKPIYFRVSNIPPDSPIGMDARTDVWYVNYLTDPNVRPYRYTDRDGERHYESLEPYSTATSTRRYTPGKIYAHAESDAILEYLAGYGIYTFGRFASWRPKELVHETWKRILEWRDKIL